MQDVPIHWRCNAHSVAMVVKLESLVAILDVVESSEPENTGGFFNVTLSEQSAKALWKLDGLELWDVGHTMVRGAKKVQPEDPAGSDMLSGKKKAPKRKAKAKPSASAADEGQATAVAEAGELTEDSFRRNAEGRDNIKRIMREIFLLDSHVCPNAPVFNLEGICKLKCAGASSVTWEQILQASPDAVECLLPGCTVSGCRWVWWL